MVIAIYKVKVKTKNVETEVFTKAPSGIEARNNVTRFLNKLKNDGSFPVSANKLKRKLTSLERTRLI